MAEDRWDFYFCRIDDVLTSVFFNESVNARVPLQGMSKLFLLRIQMKKPRPDGLSSSEEFEALGEVEEALTAEIAKPRRVKFVGRTTGGGRREFYFYAADLARVEDAAKEAMSKFPSYEFRTADKDDPDWKAYRELLYPSPRDRQRIENREVCEALKDNGDPLTAKREIDHWAYFATDAARADFIAQASRLGYMVRSAFETKGDARQFGAQVFREDFADWDSANETTLELFDLAIALGGDYDGWESPVEKG
jgi:regulator of RNase E activity RraB